MRNACTSIDTDTDPYIPQPTYLYGNEVIQFMPSRAHNQQVPVRRSRRAAGLQADDDGGFVGAGPAWAGNAIPPLVPIPDPGMAAVAVAGGAAAAAGGAAADIGLGFATHTATS